MQHPAIMPTYNPAPIALVRGEGAHVWDEDDNKYLDFMAGIAVSALGHAHPRLVSTLREQAGQIWHTSNVFRIPGQERLAERLAAATFADRAFFTNSGVEAVECAIKAARRYHHAKDAPQRQRFIAFNQAFHGRSTTTIAAAGQEKLIAGFGPLMDCFDHIDFGDITALEDKIGPETAAVMLEPVQGEGGIRSLGPNALKAIREICDNSGALLVLDEVQCGMGRTGKLFAHEWADIEPDIMAVAKGIGGGFPLGACLMTEAVGETMNIGSHGSTYGGNPMAMAVGNAVLDVMLADGFLEGVQDTGEALKNALKGLQSRYPNEIEEVRGIGLMLGLKCRRAPADVVVCAREHGLLLTGAGENVVRLLPPLIIHQPEIDEAIDKLAATFEALAKKEEKNTDE